MHVLLRNGTGLAPSASRPVATGWTWQLALWGVRVWWTVVSFVPTPLGLVASLSSSCVVSFNSSIPSINLSSCKYESGKSKDAAPRMEPACSKPCRFSWRGGLVLNFHCRVTSVLCVYCL